MNVVFVGYRKWAFNILENLITNQKKLWKVAGVITPPKPEADYDSLPIPHIIINPKKISINKLKNLSPDIFLFYGWSWYIPKEFYAERLCLILHTSPLPKYRGGSPLQHQIINGEKESAVSIIAAHKDIDAGDIYGQRKFSLDGDLNEIFQRIIETGTKETIKVLDGLANKTLKAKKQNNKKATYFKRRKPEDSEITLDDFKNKTSKEIYNFIRSLSDPYPNAYFVGRDGKKIFFTGAKLEK